LLASEGESTDDLVRALACAVVLLGCASETPREREVPRNGASANDLRATPRQRGAVIGGERVARSIAWPTADRIDVATRESLAPDALDVIARAPVPVLAPPGRADVKVFDGDHWVAVSAHGEGWTMHVQGSAQARVYPHVRAFEPTHPVRGGGGFVTRNEGVWSFNWIEHGAAYSADIECDARVVAWCDDEREVAKLVDELALVGGREVAP
jgi:hypothetical protein